jgi:hypothetical protein
LTAASITTGTHAGSTAIANASGYSKGTSTVAVDGGTGTAKKGETFKVAGDPTSYVITADVADLSSGSISFYPQSKYDWANDAAVTFDVAASTTYKVHGIVMTRSALALVTRPERSSMESLDFGMGLVRPMVDPLSNAVLTFFAKGEWNQTVNGFAVLFGGEMLRPENALLIIGSAS